MKTASLYIISLLAALLPMAHLAAQQDFEELPWGKSAAEVQEAIGPFEGSEEIPPADMARQEEVFYNSVGYRQQENGNNDYYFFDDQLVAIRFTRVAELDPQADVSLVEPRLKEQFESLNAEDAPLKFEFQQEGISGPARRTLRTRRNVDTDSADTSQAHLEYRFTVFVYHKGLVAETRQAREDKVRQHREEVVQQVLEQVSLP